MKRIFLPAFLLLAACTQPNPEQARQELILTDQLMSAMAAQEGFNKALSAYAADDFVKFNDGSYPIIGKKAFDAANGDAGPKTITWKTVKAEVAASGELGYTWGNWKFVGKDTTLYGNYFTAWKKQDGNWKMALDGGNSTPAPGGSGTP